MLITSEKSESHLFFIQIYLVNIQKFLLTKKSSKEISVVTLIIINMNPCVVPVPITSEDDRWISIVSQHKKQIKTTQLLHLFKAMVQ